MEGMKELGDRIRTERIAQGYTVKSAAEGSGLARDTWRKIEAGESVQDLKRHTAMAFLGLSEVNTEWGTVGKLEDHAAALFGGAVDLNVMFSQAVRFAATVGVIVPEVREDAERMTVALSELFTRALQLWDRVPLEERDDLLEGGDGDVYISTGGPASTSVKPPMYLIDDADAARGEDTEKPRLGDDD